MRKPALAICSFLALLTTNIFSQDLHVHYDVFRDSIYFLKNGKPAPLATVRDGKNVVIHVENYNNYLYDVSLEIENDVITMASASPEGGLKGLVPMGGMGKNPLELLLGGGGDKLLGAFNMFPGLSGKDLKEGSGWGSSVEEIKRQEQVAELKKIELAFEGLRDRVLDLDKGLNELEEKVQVELADKRLQNFAASEIAHLRYNPHLEPNQIKLLSTEYMKRIFKQEDPAKLDLPQVLKIADAQNEMPRYVQDYNKKVGRYAHEAAACKLTILELQKFNFPNSNLEVVVNKAKQFSSVVDGKLEGYADKAKLLQENLDKVKSLDPQALMALRTVYFELSNNKFAKSYTQEAKGERMRFKIKLRPLDSLERMGIREKVTPVEVRVNGGLRVKASVGLNFGQFFNRPKQYFVRDSSIQASNKDAFSPILTSFVHFYAPSNRPISVAGSFGVGFPIGGGENLQAVSFFLGPSLVFGKEQRIVLSAGIMGGKADRLTQGYKVGDRYYSDSNDAPTGSVYELGYFLGVSFNL